MYSAGCPGFRHLLIGAAPQTSRRLSSVGIEHVYIDGGALEKDIGLSRQRTQVFEFGFVQTTYLVRKTTLGA